jgi:2-polyprenyl-3-methyl-5-hydroxy-6-metoxy-1,4-benzoquinol methylase
MTEPRPNVSPELFFDTANAFQRTAALKAAIELNVFTEIGEGASASQAAEKCKTSQRGMRILLDYLVVIGFLKKEKDIYKCTPDSAVFLSKRSPAYLGSAVELLNSPIMMSAYENLAEVVRKGTTALPEGGSVAPEHPVWETFARAMAPLAAMPAEQMIQLAGLKPDSKAKILDIAAGHGMFGITFANRLPAAEIYALDWGNVLKVASANADKAGITNRFHTIPGSAFDVDYGTDFDLALITNFLHHFDPPTCIRFLKRVHAALKPEGKAITLEFVPNEDRVTPPISAAFSLIMLASTPSGDAYTFRELEEMFLDAGFSRCSLHSMEPSVQHVVVAEK